MTGTASRMGWCVALASVVVLANVGCAGARPRPREVPPPPGVTAAIQKAFPGAELAKTHLREKDGLKLYSVDFTAKAGKAKADVTEDGLIVEVKTETAAEALPKAVARAVQLAARDAAIKRVEKKERSAEVTDGKLMKLDAAKVVYKVDLTKEGLDGKIEVAADGTVDKPLEWRKAKPRPREVPPPPAVAAAIRRAFPGAKLARTHLREKDGLKLYSIDFTVKTGKAKADVAEDGSVVEVRTELAADALPKAVAQAVEAAAKGAEIRRIEKKERTATLKLVQLGKPKVVYKVDLTKDGRDGKIEVAADGTVEKPLEWRKPKDHKGKKGKGGPKAKGDTL